MIGQKLIVLKQQYYSMQKDDIQKKQGVCKEISGGFELIIPENQLEPQSEEIQIIYLDQQKSDQIEKDQSQTQKQCKSESAIICFEDYYLIANKQIAYEVNNQQEWEQFFGKVLLYKKTCQEIKQEQVSMQKHLKVSVKERNSIIKMKKQQINLRKNYWDSFLPDCEFQHYESENQLQQNENQEIKDQLTQEQRDALKKSLKKIKRLIAKIRKQFENDSQVQRIVKDEGKILKWIEKSIINYALIDVKVGFNKNLWYLCFGIVISYPQFSQQKCTQIFHHFMYEKNFRSIFFEGTIKFFQELTLLEQDLNQAVPQLYKKIQQECQIKNLFISYYRTFLIFKIQNLEVIRKIMQLLLIYGIDFIRTFLVEILKRIEVNIKDHPDLLEILSEKIVEYYYTRQTTEKQENSQSIAYKTLDLFIIQ